MFIQVSLNLAVIPVNRLLGQFGHIPIAVLGLMMRFQMFAFMPVVGISQGLLPSSASTLVPSNTSGCGKLW